MNEKTMNNNAQSTATLEDVEKVSNSGVALTFAEYQAIKEPAVNIIINDYAVKLVERAKERGETVTMDDARKIAAKEIPATFVPEWMRNLRVSANMAGTELCYLEGIKSALDNITELLQVCWEEQIDAYINRHANDFKNQVRAAEAAEGSK